MNRISPAPSIDQNAVGPPGRLKWVGPASLGLWVLSCYFLAIFIPLRSLSRYFVPLAVICFVGIYWFLRWLDQRQWVSQAHLQGVTAASFVLLVTILAVDNGYAVYTNSSQKVGQDFTNEYFRFTDRALWEGEVHPRVFYPTEKNFFIHKPSVRVSASVYGRAYYPDLLKSPTMVNLVLEQHHVTYIIDENGFRETTPLEQARIFVLGDSLALAQHMEQEKTWPKLLERAIAKPIYNLGVSNTGPKQELLLLEYLFRAKGDSFRPQHILWMISEGSDLEDTYENFRSIHPADRLTTTFRGTLLEPLALIPVAIKNASVINQFWTGHLTLALPHKRAQESDPYVVDGIQLDWPLYHSSRFGYRCFEPYFMKRATLPESYVLEHPNRPLLDQTFREMAVLSMKHGFDVTVILGPSDSRVYGEYFENFPGLSKEPYFLNYVERLSRSLGFRTVDLYSLMKPYTRNELLFFRDDVHWNERGNAVVAEIIAKHALDIPQTSAADELRPLPPDVSAQKQ